MKLITLANHNEDIQQLIDKGFSLGIDTNHLVVRDIPYLDSEGALRIGAIVSKLDDIDGFRVMPTDHQVYFCGSSPYTVGGTPILNLGGGPHTLELKSADITVERSFSSKPVGRERYHDHFEKITKYVSMISGHAMEMYDVTPYMSRIAPDDVDYSVFKFNDTLSSRAEIADISKNFKDDIIAIIGLGGTGSYVLDFIVKTPVKEIRGFDSDLYHIHTSFRSPGRVMNDGEFGKKKAEVYSNRYQNFRNGLTIHPKNITIDSTSDLQNVTFAFVCVDKGEARKEIFDLLMHLEIPFIDVGMGLNRTKGPIDGTLRTTYYSKEEAQERRKMGLSPMMDHPNDIYRNNIQIAELNALNAALAVTKYKQLRNFYYSEDNTTFHTTFRVNNFKGFTD